MEGPFGDPLESIQDQSVIRVGKGNPLSPFGQCQSGSFGSPSEGLLGVLLGGKFVVGNHLDRWVKTEFNIKETILCNNIKCLNM